MLVKGLSGLKENRHEHFTPLADFPSGMKAVLDLMLYCTV